MSDWEPVGVFIGGAFAFNGLSEEHVQGKAFEFGGSTAQNSSVTLTVATSVFAQVSLSTEQQVTLRFEGESEPGSMKWIAREIRPQADGSTKLNFLPVT